MSTGSGNFGAGCSWDDVMDADGIRAFCGVESGFSFPVEPNQEMKVFVWYIDDGITLGGQAELWGRGQDYSALEYGPWYVEKAPAVADLTEEEVRDCMTYLADQISWCAARP